MTNAKEETNTTKALIGDFQDRIEQLMKDESYASFAEKTNLSVSQVQSMMRGQVPGIDKAAAISEALGIRLDWLIFGKGPRYNAPEESNVVSLLSPEAASKAFVDLETIRETIKRFEEIREDGQSYTPQQVADIIALMSVIFSGTVEDQDPDQLLEMVKNI